MEKLFKNGLYEVWRPVVGYEGFYEVSSEGMIKSLYGATERIMKQTTLWGKKYKQISLHKNKTGRTYLVHQLVVSAFPEICGTISDGLEINHKDENPANNCAWNLEVCTHNYNVHYGTGIERHKETCRLRPKKPAPPKPPYHGNSKPINQLTQDGVFIKRWNNAIEVKEALSINPFSIYNVLAGRHKSAGGFRWEYAK